MDIIDEFREWAGGRDCGSERKCLMREFARLGPGDCRGYCGLSIKDHDFVKATAILKSLQSQNP